MNHTIPHCRQRDTFSAIWRVARVLAAQQPYSLPEGSVHVRLGFADNVWSVERLLGLSANFGES